MQGDPAHLRAPASVGSTGSAGLVASVEVGVALRSAVFDTNVVLDWLWFGDPRIRAVAGAVREGRLLWVGSAPMRDELAAVIGRGSRPARGRDGPTVLAEFDRWCRLGTPAPAGALQCSDPDDQKFLDLALAHRAAALFTRDRCVLRLARRARAFGLWVGQPEVWPG